MDISVDTAALTMEMTYPTDNEIVMSDTEDRGLSDSDITSDENETSDENVVPFISTSLSSLTGPILFSSEFTKRDLFLGKLATAIKSNESYKKTLLEFQLLNNFLINGNFPKCKSSLWRLLSKDKSCITDHKYCRDCFVYFGPEANSLISNCCGIEGRCHNLGHFLQLSLKNQLQQLFSLPGMKKLLNYRFSRSESGSMSDLFDGKKYKELCEPGKFLNNPNNFTLMFNADGVSMGDSSKASAYPIWVQLNELPPHSRRKHMMLAGIWVDNKKPILNDFLLPFVEELDDLYKNGITWKTDTNELIQSKFIAPICTVDSVMRWEILNMTQFNGLHGCTWCYAEGNHVTRRRVYNDQEKPALRDHRSIVANGLDAMKLPRTSTTKDPSVMGVKGPSVLALISEFDLVDGMVVDSLHQGAIGVAKQHTEQVVSARGEWCKDNFKNIEEVHDEINKTLLQIKIPTRISRTPRNITQRHLWKASEWRNWLFYYSLPCLKNVLKPKYFDHYAALVNSLFILNRDTITDHELTLVDRDLCEYVKNMEQLFGRLKITYNVHLLTHVVKSVRDWGPLWAYSTFSFESWNGHIVKTITSPTDRQSQMATRFLMRKSLITAARDTSIHLVTRNFMNEVLNKGKKTYSDKFECGGIKRDCDAIPSEKNALFLSGYSCTKFESYTKATFMGVEYQCTDGKIRKNDNSIIFCETIGFARIEKIVVINDNNEKVSGIFVQKLRQNRRLYNTSHMFAVTLNKTLYFVPTKCILGPAVLIRINNTICAARLPNCWEAD